MNEEQTSLKTQYEESQKQLVLLFNYLVDFIRHPFDEIKNIPEIQWKALIIFQFCLISFSVIVSNLLAPFAISITHMIISLVSSLLATALISIFFHYLFLIICYKSLNFIKIYSLVLFAHIPLAIFHLASSLFPPSDLIGLGFSAFLMFTGLTERFNIEKRLASKVILILYSVFSIYWMIHLFTFRKYPILTEPQNLDKIEKEIITQ